MDDSEVGTGFHSWPIKAISSDVDKFHVQENPNLPINFVNQNYMKNTIPLVNTYIIINFKMNKISANIRIEDI